MRSRRESPLLPYTTAHKLPSNKGRTKGTSTLKRICVLSGIGLIFLIFFIGTFNYIGYNEGVDTVETGLDSETRRGLAEDASELIKPASQLATRQNVSNADHQEQTQQLQTQGSGHAMPPETKSDKAPVMEEKKGVLSADAAARAIDSAELVHTFDKSPSGLYNLVADDIDGVPVDLSIYRGNVTLVVNVASQCGYTESNYKGLKELYTKHHKAGFEILAFPCNSFGNQEPGDPQSIKEFVRVQHGIEFPLFSKVEISGSNAHPVFKLLKDLMPKTNGLADIWEPKWNFSKWLVNKQGIPVKHYDSDFNSSLLEQDIAAELLQTS